MTEIACVTWNVHRAQGRDGRIDPERTVTTLLRDVSPPGRHQVLALQEADTACPPHAGLLDIDRIAAATGLRCLHDDPQMRWGAQSHGFLGKIVFVHPDLRITARAVLDLPGHCHRGAVICDMVAGGVPVRFVVVHLSLAQALRIVQMRIIAQYLHRQPLMQTVVMGDLNEWRPWSGLALSPHLLGRRLVGGVRRTFPAQRPLLPLDRILSDRVGAVRGLQVIDTPGVRATSDHLPLMARVAV